MIFSMASGVNDSIYGKHQAPIKKFISDDEKKYIKKSKIKEVYNIVDSKKWAESFTSMTSKGDFAPVGEGGEYPLTSMQEGYDKIIIPYTWKSSFEATQEMIEDAKLFKVKSSAKTFMTSYTRTREKFAAQLLMNANKPQVNFGGHIFDTTCNDSKPLFSDHHTSITGECEDQSNYLNMPFTYDNLLYVEEHMQKFKNHDGEEIGIEPDTIIIPNNTKIKKAVANAILTSAGEPGKQTHSFNLNESRWNVIVWDKFKNIPGVTDDSWMLMDSERNKVDGLMFIDRVKLTVKSYIDQKTDNNVFGGRARFNLGFVNPYCVCGMFPGVAQTVVGQ